MLATASADLALAGDVADHGVGVGKLLLEGPDAVRRTGQGNHAKSSGGEAPHDRGPGAGTDTCDNGERLVSHCLCSAIAQCPLKAGLRLSTKARTASLWSVVRADRTMFSASWSIESRKSDVTAWSRLSLM